MRSLLICALCAPLAAQAPELRATAADRTALSITIYQNDLAAIRDTRRVHLPAGESRLAFADVAATIRPKSAYLLDPGPGLKVVERNFDFNLLSPESLAMASLGQDAALRNPVTKQLDWGTQVSVPWPNGVMNPNAPAMAKMARLPSAYFVRPTHQLLIRMPGGYEALGQPGPIYKRLPYALRSAPTLLQTLRADVTGLRDLSLLYTATGLSWRAHYIATLDADAKHLDLAAFATVENKSGIDYPDAAFQLIAGVPNVVPDPDPHNALDGPETDVTVTVMALEAVGSGSGPPTFHEEKLSEYPLFTLDRPATLRSGQQKQLALFQASRVPVRVQAIVAPGRQWFEDENGYLKSCLQPFEPEAPTYSPLPLPLDLMDDKIWYEQPFDGVSFEQTADHHIWLVDHRPPVQLEGTIQNAAVHGLGRALPAGSLDLRYQTPEGACFPMGEASVDGTPSGGELRIELGNARGLRAERKVVSLHRVETSSGLAWELEVAVELSNLSDRSMKTTFREPIFADWELQHSNLRGHRSGENAYDFDFVSKPRSVFTLRYRVRMPDKDVSESS